jgi:O-antigen ligase
MSNFDHTTFSPWADTALEEPLVMQSATAEKSESLEERTHVSPKPAPKLFHYVLLIYIFLFCTRIPELIPSIRASLAASVILLAGAFATGQVTAITRTKLGKILIAFTVWVAICVPFSVWIGGSVDQLKITIQSTLLVAFIMAFVRTLREVRNLVYTIAAAMATVAVLSFSTYTSTGIQGERLGLGESTSLQDPNYMALYLLIGLPFVYLGLTRGKGLLRVILALCLPLMLAAIARSGSRMAMILFFAGLLLFLIRASSKERIGVLVGTAVLAAVALPLLPRGVIERFTTFFEPKSTASQSMSQGPDVGSSEAAESAQSRYDLLMRSIELTVRHPLFGVGPGQFTVADNNLAKAEGKARGMWHFSHNAYLQTSSESGIIGMVLYIAALWVAYRPLTRIRKRGPTPLIRQMATYIQLSLWMVILGGFFLNLGFGGVPFIIMALSAVFQLAVAPQMKTLRSNVAAV